MHGNRRHQRKQRPEALLELRPKDDTEIESGILRRNPLALQTAATRSLLAGDDAQTLRRAVDGAPRRFEIGRRQRIEPQNLWSKPSISMLQIVSRFRSEERGQARLPDLETL